jgi:hypothetical protein
MKLVFFYDYDGLGLHCRFRILQFIGTGSDVFTVPFYWYCIANCILVFFSVEYVKVSLRIYPTSAAIPERSSWCQEVDDPRRHLKAPCVSSTVYSFMERLH